MLYDSGLNCCNPSSSMYVYFCTNALFISSRMFWNSFLNPLIPDSLNAKLAFSINIFKLSCFNSSLNFSYFTDIVVGDIASDDDMFNVE